MPYPPLLPWYAQNKRVLPFRGTHDPYAIWVSEIMLQQTLTETVADYYTRFLQRFPDISALAGAQEQEVLKYWEGLGYYSRARNLHRAAKRMQAEFGGQFPRDYEAIRALPGIGDYTAAAVASIAFQLPHPAIDGNLTRVISRMHGVREDVDMPSVKREIARLARENIDTDAPGDWNQALMDLGATICTPGTPDCARCPLQALCDACAAGDADLLPVRAAVKPPLAVDVGVALVVSEGHILVQQREATLLRGLWVFMLCEGDSTRGAMDRRLRALGISATFQGALGEARHVFTHRIWNMKMYHYTTPGLPAVSGCQWVDDAGLAALPFPTAMKKPREAGERLL